MIYDGKKKNRKKSALIRFATEYNAVSLPLTLCLVDIVVYDLYIQIFHKLQTK